MSLWLNYHHLYYFHTIATLGSLSGAAQKLRLSKSALSIQIKQFEERLQKKLFDRKGKKLVLNADGKTLFIYSTEIFKLGEELKESLEHAAAPEKSRPIQIGIAESLPKTLAAQLLNFSHFHSSAPLRLFENTHTQLFEDLDQQRLQLVLSNTLPLPGEYPLHVKKLGRSPIKFYASKKHLDLKKNFYAQVQSLSIILPTEDSPLYTKIEGHLLAKNIRVSKRIEVQDTSLQKIMAAQGIGIIAIAAIAVKDFIKDSKLYEIASLQQYEDYYLVSSARRTLKSPVKEIFHNFSIHPNATQRLKGFN